MFEWTSLEPTEDGYVGVEFLALLIGPRQPSFWL